MGYPRKNRDQRVSLVSMEDQFWFRRINLEILKEGYRGMLETNFRQLLQGDLEQNASIVGNRMRQGNALPMVKCAGSDKNESLGKLL